MLERVRIGGLLMTPSCRTSPLGCPSFQLKRSPFTPATVVVDEIAFCIAVTRWRPRIVPFASTGLSE